MILMWIISTHLESNIVQLFTFLLIEISNRCIYMFLWYYTCEHYIYIYSIFYSNRILMADNLRDNPASCSRRNKYPASGMQFMI